MRAKALQSIVGKTIKEVTAYDDPSLTIQFTDGSSIGILLDLRPELECAFFRDGNDAKPVTSKLRGGARG